MKAIPWLIYFTIHSTLNYAQTIQTPPKAIVSNDAMNVLYRGLSNSISLIVPGYSWDELTVTCPDCTRFKGKEGKYIIYPGETDELKLFVHSIRKSDSISLIFIHRFRIKKVPNPIMRLCDKFDGDSLTIDSRNTNLNYTLIPLLTDFDLDIFARINEFTIAYTHKGKQRYKTIKNNKIDNETLTILETLPKGAPIFFPSIKVALSDETVRDLHVMFFKR